MTATLHKVTSRAWGAWHYELSVEGYSPDCKEDDLLSCIETLCARLQTEGGDCVAASWCERRWVPMAPPKKKARR